MTSPPERNLLTVPLYGACAVECSSVNLHKSVLS